jgi:DNA-binding GntR family transcriptional regulator
MDGDRPAADLHARLTEGVRAMVIEGELADGVKVPEAALCARFGVSRTPMREALKALAAEGVLELLPNRGARVAPLRADTLAAVFEAKGALERLIGQAAAGRADAADLAELEDLHRALGAALRRADVAEYTVLNERFHARLAAAARNPVAEQIYAGLMAQALRARHRINLDPGRMAASYAEHEGIMTALRARTPLDLAERLARHNAATAEALLALFEGRDAKEGLGPRRRAAPASDGA